MYPDGIVVNAKPGNEITVGAIKMATGCEITINGKGNKVSIGSDVTLRNTRIYIESSMNSVVIGDRANITASIIQKVHDGNSLSIGEGVSIGGANIINGEGTSISIGKESMLAWGIEIRSTDSHGIFDLRSGARINEARNIVIGNRVWIAAKASILKGSTIPDGCVVAFGAITSKAFDTSDSIIAGVPAKVVREGVRWERPLLG